ncbi:MAG: DUF1540 domain-containing protein [Bacilli bacterium]|nr:DUF1540 domain-containing protein [Bacilli bacterium]MDD3305328.1 DUF1540 domain-containing protein [Bacilli bacterium]MDD4054019.1 DUF1540 domain-containing protein [Bacilli bacterium]MDD4411777.1 DUF1540 domain-containing protein [Bacilli bacterium]
MRNDSIGCTVDHCKYYDKKCCTLDKIKVAKCDAENDADKEATMCDSYEME